MKMVVSDEAKRENAANDEMGKMRKLASNTTEPQTCRVVKE